MSVAPPSGFQASNSSGLDQGRAYSGPLGTGGFPGGPFRQRSNQHVNGHDNVYWASEETSCVAPSDSGVSAEDWTLGTEARGGSGEAQGWVRRGRGGDVAGEWGGCCGAKVEGVVASSPRIRVFDFFDF